MSLPHPDRAAVFLDFDGTLVEIAPRPGDVTVADRLTATLRQLIDRHDGAVAVVTGRKIEDIDRFLGLPVAAAGMHGLELRAAPGAPITSAPTPPEIDTLRERLLAHRVLSGGVKLEDKGAGLAVHYRAEPEREEDVRRVLDEVTADLHSLGLIRGKMVVEAKARSHDKGAAVRHFMADAPFSGRVPLFLGDDVTDEDGIVAAQNAGGHGIKVGEGETVAQYRLPDVPAVHAYLEALAEPR